MILLADMERGVRVDVHDTPVGRILAWAWVESLRTGEDIDLTRLGEIDGKKITEMAATAAKIGRFRGPQVVR